MRGSEPRELLAQLLQRQTRTESTSAYDQKVGLMGCSIVSMMLESLLPAKPGDDEVQLLFALLREAIERAQNFEGDYCTGAAAVGSILAAFEDALERPTEDR